MSSILIQPLQVASNGHAAKSSKPGLGIEQLVGNTPLLHLPSVTSHLPQSVAVYAKAEWTNPGGSVKDRPALNIIRQAMARGELRPGMTLIDSTSGNTGIAYAMFGAALGIRVKLVVPANASRERLQILRAYGVDLVLSDPAEGSDGAIRLVRQMVSGEPGAYFYADQYNNPDNWMAHYLATGVEIWEQTDGAVTHFVAALGTSGTLTGTGRRLREYNPAIQVIGVQPDSPFHGLEGLKHMPTALKPGIYDPDFPDRILEANTEKTYQMCRRLAREEGLLVGISSAAALIESIHLAEELAGRNERATIVTIFPDNAAKYLSDPLWSE